MIKVVTITRGYKTDEVTLGMLQIEDIPHEPIYTLENPWVLNKPYISSIPEGEYMGMPFNGNKYKDVYEIVPVQDRSAILIHHGNYEKDTMGCILVGLSSGMMNGEPAIMQSRNAMAYLKSLLGKEEFAVIIR